MVSAALVKGNDIGSQPGFLFAFFFNRSDHSVARTGSLVAGHAWVDRAVYARSHILNRHQDVELEIGRFEFIGLRFRIKAVPQIIVLRVAHLLQCVGPHMVVCDDESIRRNERAAAAGIETDTGLLQMLKPLRCRLELIFFFELVQRRRIEKPHPFVGKSGCSEAGRACNSERL